MRKTFYICLAIFFVSGVSLFYILDKNYATIKPKIIGKFSEIQSGNDIITFDNNEEKETIEKEYNLNFEKLNINLNIGDISIESYDGNNIKIKSTIPKKSIKDYLVTEKENTLDIHANVAQSINIKVPRKKIMEAYIINEIGDISAENMKNISIELNTGDLRLENIDGINLIKMQLGDLHLNNVKNINSVKIGSGDFRAKVIEQNRDFSIESGLGDVNLEITNSFDGQIETHIGLGDLLENNFNSKGNRYKGTINLGSGDLHLKGVD